MMYYQNKQTGFSLVETLVAVSLLLIVIVGPMTISARTAKSSSFASEQVQAFFLAQEGLELAQKARDDGTIEYFKDITTNPSSALTPWSNFTNNTGGDYKDCFDPGGCGLQWLDGSDLKVPVIKCNNSTDECRIYRSVANGRPHFSHNSANPPTLFTRKIYFENTGPSLDSDREVHVRSVVTWRTGSIVADQQVVVDTYLYNIYDTP